MCLEDVRFMMQGCSQSLYFVEAYILSYEIKMCIHHRIRLFENEL